MKRQFRPSTKSLQPSNQFSTAVVLDQDLRLDLMTLVKASCRFPHEDEAAQGTENPSLQEVNACYYGKGPGLPASGRACSLLVGMQLMYTGESSCTARLPCRDYLSPAQCHPSQTCWHQPR